MTVLWPVDKADSNDCNRVQLLLYHALWPKEIICFSFLGFLLRKMTKDILCNFFSLFSCRLNDVSGIISRLKVTIKMMCHWKKGHYISLFLLCEGLLSIVFNHLSSTIYEPTDIYKLVQHEVCNILRGIRFKIEKVSTIKCNLNHHYI